MPSFALKLDKWMDGTEETAERAVAKLTVQAFQGIVTKTPVDTGRARGNWNLSSGSPDTETDESATSSRSAMQVKKAKSVASVAVRVGKDIYITNNLPYIRRLEYGHSQQSEAMVRRTMSEIRAKYQ